MLSTESMAGRMPYQATKGDAHMTHSKIITQEDGKTTVWADIVTADEFQGFMQYIIDGCDNPEKFILLNPDNGVTYDAYKMATLLYGIRKRTFTERMRNAQAPDYT